MIKEELKDVSILTLGLLASAGAVVCCSLPIILATLGVGAVLVSEPSWLPSVSEYKFIVFLISGIVLLVAGHLTRLPGRQYPNDPKQAKLCSRMSTLNHYLFWAAVAIWSAGFLSAYLILPFTFLVGMI